MVYRRGVVLKSLAIWQIYLIVISMFSFAFLIGEVSEVSGQSSGWYIDNRNQIFYSNSIPAGTPVYGTAEAAEAARAQITAAGRGGSEGSSTNMQDPKFPDPNEPPVVDRGSVKRPPENPAPTVTTTPTITTGAKEFYSDKPFKYGIDDANGYTLTENGMYQFTNGDTPVGDPLTKADFDTALKDKGVNFNERGGYKDPLTGMTGGFGHLLSGLMFAVAVAGAIQLIGNLAGFDDSLTNALSIAAASGIMATNIIHSFGPSGFGAYSTPFTETTVGLTNAGWIGLGVAVVVFALIYKKESTQIVNFQCLPFEAPIGGKDCEKCNNDPYRPCSEYRCRALGQTCELVNVGSTEEKCVAVNPNDATSPTITPWTTPLTENHRYTSHATRPASLGTKIVLNGAANGCIKAFTPLTFGITTNEPAQCKIDVDHKNTFDEMQFFFGNTNFYLYNHTQQFSLPSPDSVNTEAPELKNDGKYDFFVRCRDKNGNENVDEFAVQFCVDPSPDTTAPLIVETSIPSESYVKFNAGSVPLVVYVNEPAECKWSTQDKSYDIMENSMRCATSLTQINARELYACSTNLTGIADRQENKFYFRCKDQPLKPDEDRNINVVSYEFKLRGSQPLNIVYVAPNGTSTGNTNTVPVELKVTTDDGANEGVAICSFSPTGAANSYIPMFETKAVEHKQRLDLTTGNYNYKLRCVDYGGNGAEANVTFSVVVDTTPPLITRAYHDSAYEEALKIVTNEDAACAYSLNSCNFNFNEGVELVYSSSSNKKSHYAEWKPGLVYYIKCSDSFGNQPAPNSCSMVVSATNIA